MSDQEDNISLATAAQPSQSASAIINLTPSDDKPTVTITSTNDSITATDNEKNDDNEDNNIDSHQQLAGDVVSGSGGESIESQSSVLIRSESVIRSPPKAVITPVIKVLDYSTTKYIDSSKIDQSLCENETKRSFATNVITQVPSSTNPTSFLHSSSNKVPANPFLRTSSFSSNLSSNSDDSNSEASSTVIFAAPKLISPLSTQSAFESSFLRPSVLRVGDSSTSEDGTKTKESVSTIKTFISLNKDDIGKIKTPSFIQSSLESNSMGTINGFSSLFSDSAQDGTNGGEGTSNDSSSNSISTKSTFLFGEKLAERVVMSEEIMPIKKELRIESIISRNEPLLSFSDVTNQETPFSGDTESTTDSKKNEITTTATAAATTTTTQKQQTNLSVFKRKYEVITGEEDEQNVLSIYGKLYSWDNDKVTWIEKGRGQLRLNDVIKNEKLCSRLVMRTTGVLRVILNAHIVAGMKFELANDNCLRFTYIDGIYLIKANVKDIEQLNSAIDYRLREITKRAKTSDEQSDSDSLDNTVVPPTVSDFDKEKEEN